MRSQSREWSEFEQLTSDVEVKTDDGDIGQLHRYIQHLVQHLHRDTKLVLAQARSDVLVRVRIDIRVHADSHTRLLALGNSQLADDLQLWDGFNVETSNVGIQSEVDFPVGLTDTGEDHLRRRETSLQASLNLTAAHAVTTQAALSNQLQQGRINIGLHSIVHMITRVLGSLSVDGV